MHNTFRKALLAAALFIVGLEVHAQTPLGQPTLDEKKIQIWCATARFVYNDNGRSNLNNALNCSGTLKEFEASIRTDSQRVYSRLYQPLEGRGVMYKGLGNDQSRLTKLTNEIVRTLEASPARRKDPARMAQVQRLKGAFASYVNQGTPMPEDIGMTEATASAETFDTTVAAGGAEAESLMADDSDSGTVASTPMRASADSPMTRLFGPIALILSLLSLVLWFLERRVLRNHIEELRSRSSRHRNELESLKSGDFAGTMTGNEVTKEISPTQRRQIEQLVDKLVQERLAAEQKPHGRPTAAPEPAMPRVANEPGRKPAPPQPQPRPQAAPAVVSPAPPMPEVAAPPMPMPAGSPASAPRDEFDSLVPPVQLPNPTPAPAAVPPPPPAPAPHVPEPMPVGHFYVKVPVNGGFSDYDLHTTAQHDSIYEITPDPQRPDVASFRINPNQAVHAYAIQSAQYSLREACRYEPPTGAVGRIVTDEPGQLRKVGGTWQIEHKAAIRFE